ncbi:MAG TPA: penicillin-binding protein, partial [Streptomyces sp.]
ENNKSALFAGYTPELTTVVALYGESTKEGGGQVSLTGTANSGRANGGGFPARIWADYTLGALGGGSSARFDLEDVEHGETSVTPSESTSPSESASPEESPSHEAEETTAPPSDPATEEPTPPVDSSSESPEESPSTSPSDSESPSDGDQQPDPGRLFGQ